jgi:hypothetical protein
MSALIHSETLSHFTEGALSACGVEGSTDRRFSCRRALSRPAGI